MKLLSLSLLCAIALTIVSPHPDPDLEVDRSDIGLLFTLPASWRPNGPMIRQSKIDYYTALGESYEAPDSNALIFGFNSYMHVEVDSSLLPAPEAYTGNFLAIRMEGYYNWFTRFLWAMGKRTIWEDLPIMERAGVRVIRQEVLRSDDPRKVIPDSYAVEFEIMPESATVGTKGRIFFITRGTRCYQIILEGDQLHYEALRPVHDAVLQSIQFID